MGRINTKAKHRRPVSDSAAPSRGQRKRALKKASLIKKIGLTQPIQRGKDEPKDEPTLMRVTDTKGERSSGVKPSAFQRVSSNRGKKTLMKAEIGQINAAMASPSFQQNPFAAIQAHLRHRNTTNSPAPVDEAEVSKPGKLSRKKLGHHSGDRRGDVKPKAKPYKGRNAKMRAK